MNVVATPRLPVAVACATVGVLSAIILGLPEVALVVAPWFVLLLLGTSRSVPTRPRIDVQLSDERVIAGDEVTVTTTVNASVASTVSLIPSVRRPERGDEDGDIGDAVATTVAVEADEPTESVATLRFTKWGAWRVEGHRLTVTPRYGLFTAATSDNATADIRVHPRTSELRRLVAPRFLRGAGGRHTARTTGSGIEYADIRPFAAGDEVRTINWRASARAGSLQVTQRHPERSADVVLLLDNFIEAGHNIERVLSLTVNAALAAGTGHLGLTDRVGFVEFGGLVRWLPPAMGQVHLHRAADFLLQSLTFANRSDKQLPMLAPNVWPPRATVLAISPLLDDRFIEALFEARRRGHDVSVIEIDTFVRDDLGPQDDVQALSTRLVEAERNQLRRSLADHGIAAVTWHNDEPVDVPLVALAGVRQRLRVRQ